MASWAHGEDAALWQIDADRVGVLTVDFITPVADDPAKFGEIAAANALSDVYAMGGRPLVALNVVGFPTSCEPIETLQAILQGGARKVAESGAVLAGGHSVQDEEPKYGLVVFGEVARDRIWRVDGAHDGDVLLLTKPLGTGIAVTAIKAGLLGSQETEEAMRSMSLLNNIETVNISDHMRSCIHACTDVTGFGLAGHALDMTPENLTLSIRAADLPMLPGTAEMAAMGMLPAGLYANREHTGSLVQDERNNSDPGTPAVDLMFDPQTSGGLLLAVEPDAADELTALLKTCFPHTVSIGQFSHGKRGIRLL